MRQDHDVVILGAGVGACLLASELSRSADVLVLEKRGVRHARSYGSTSRVAAAELAISADCKVGGHDTVTLDLDRLAAVLSQRVIFENGKVHSYDSFRSNRKRQLTEVCVNGYQHTARLVIDCMGHRSPFLMVNRFGHMVDTCIIQEGTVPIRSEDCLDLSDVFLSAHRGRLEVLPLVELSHLSLVVRGSQLRRASNARLDWRIAVNIASGVVRAVSSEARSTIVPLFKIDKPISDGFLALPEPQQQLDASTCLRSAVASYRAISASIVHCLTMDDLSISALNRHVKKEL